MIFCSYNIRGLNKKISFVKDFITNNNVGLIALLETHVKKESAKPISSMVSPRFSWLFNYDSHYNGRVWVGWDPNKWQVTSLLQGSQHISCNVLNIGSNASFFVSFVYAHNTHEERRQLWLELTQFQTSITSNGVCPAWILLGDFNVCLNVNEIEGGSLRITPGMNEFKDFLEEIEGLDLCYSGNFLTWWDSNKTKPVQKKLDRALVNPSWLGSFALSHVKFLPRGLSDHCPVLVDLGTARNKLNKPFQIFNHIMAHPEFLNIVSSAWNTTVMGDPWYIVTSKLKRVKLALKQLNNNVGNLHNSVLLARNSLLQFQENLPSVPTPSQFDEEARLSSILVEALHREEIFLRQKARVKWLKLGDGNNSFFFNSCRSRWNTNKLLVLVDDSGASHSTHKDISTLAVDYFKSVLGTEAQTTPLDPEVSLPQLSNEQKASLVETFQPDEVLQTLKRMAKNKSPGPDGFSPEFYIAAWSIVGVEVTRAIIYFFESLHLPRVINSVAITLVPKSANASSLSHYRPISCCNTLYKCITKLLASRLKNIMPSIISQNQSAFVPHRSIGDNILLAQSLCRDYHKEVGAPRCAIKLDIHKAFDNMNWKFLFETMHRMGFPALFLHWIHTCITTCMISLKINGSLEGYFESKKGLRQGDPLSPYLFVIGMEVLSSYLRHDLLSSTHFSFHWRAKDLKLSHLIFADDMFLFCKGDNSSISAMLRSVDRFSNCSGLRPNPDKSECFFCNVPSEVIDSTITTTGFQQGKLPIKYLGLPLITTKLKAQDCEALILRLCFRIESWTNRFLRYSGRLQLLKSVLIGIQGFWAAYLFLPKNILGKIQSCFSKFLWGGNHDAKCQHKVAWSECCLPKLEGGLGISDLHMRNKAAILLQIWRLSHPNSPSLWIRWVHRELLRNKPFWAAKIPSGSSWAVRQIMNLRTEARRYLTYNIGVDSNFFMWHDPWLENCSLYSRLGISIISSAESTSLARIRDFLSDGRWVPPSSNHVKVIELRHLLSNIVINRVDAVCWQGSKSVKLSTVYNSIRRVSTPPPWVATVWHSYAIPKCAFFMWLALKQRLLTKDRMITFGIAVNPTCLLCQCNAETTDHLFSTCPYTCLILNCSPVPISCNWADWQNGNITLGSMTNIQKHIGWLFVSVVIYVIWQERNRRLHASGLPRQTCGLSSIIKRMVREKLFSCKGFQKKVARDPSLIPLLY